MNSKGALFHKPKPKIVPKVLLFLAILIVLFVLVFDINWFRPQLNQTISTSSDSQTNIGRIDYSLTNPSIVTLSDIQVQQEGVEVSVKQVTVKVDFWRLFRKDLIIEHLSIEEPNIVIDADKLNQPATVATETTKSADTSNNSEQIGPAERPQLPLPIYTMRIDQLLISSLTIEDVSSARQFSISGTNIRLSNLNLVEDALFNQNAHLPGAKIQLYLANLELQQEQIGSIKLLAQTETDKLYVEQLKVENSPSVIDLTSTIYLPFEAPKIELSANNSTLSLEQFSHLMQDSKIKPQGLVSFSTDLTTKIDPNNPDAMMQNLLGSFSANIQPGKVTGVNVNSALTALTDSQKTSLLDIGGYVLTGPLGMIAGQLLELGSGITAMGGETQVEHLSLISQIEQGKVDLTNTALATDKYRIALKGKADIIKQEFDNFEFAILNDQGCADVSQTLNGPMSNPTSAVADSLLKSLASPVTDIVSGVTNKISDCEVFYSGSVQQPQG